MFRKIALLFVVAVGVTAPLAIVPSANASKPPQAQRTVCYKVYFRNCSWPQGKWQCYGKYSCNESACAARDHLNCQPNCQAVIR
jgi:hypothetical protein